MGKVITTVVVPWLVEAGRISFSGLVMLSVIIVYVFVIKVLARDSAFADEWRKNRDHVRLVRDIHESHGRANAQDIAAVAIERLDGQRGDLDPGQSNCEGEYEDEEKSGEESHLCALGLRSSSRWSGSLSEV